MNGGVELNIFEFNENVGMSNDLFGLSSRSEINTVVARHCEKRSQMRKVTSYRSSWMNPT